MNTGGEHPPTGPGDGSRRESHYHRSKHHHRRHRDKEKHGYENDRHERTSMTRIHGPEFMADTEGIPTLPKHGPKGKHHERTSMNRVHGPELMAKTDGIPTLPKHGHDEGPELMPDTEIYPARPTSGHKKSHHKSHHRHHHSRSRNRHRSGEIGHNHHRRHSTGNRVDVEVPPRHHRCHSSGNHVGVEVLPGAFVEPGSDEDSLRDENEEPMHPDATSPPIMARTIHPEEEQRRIRLQVDQALAERDSAAVLHGSAVASRDLELGNQAPSEDHYQAQLGDMTPRELVTRSASPPLRQTMEAPHQVDVPPRELVTRSVPPPSHPQTIEAPRQVNETKQSLNITVPQATSSSSTPVTSSVINHSGNDGKGCFICGAITFALVGSGCVAAFFVTWIFWWLLIPGIVFLILSCVFCCLICCRSSTNVTTVISNPH